MRKKFLVLSGNNILTENKEVKLNKCVYQYAKIVEDSTADRHFYHCIITILKNVETLYHFYALKLHEHLINKVHAQMLRKL